MKKLFFTGLFAVCGLAAHSQTYNYSSTAGWMPYASYYDFENAALGCWLNPLTTGSPTGSISITGGVVDYNEVHGGQENRIAMYLGNFYDQQFTMDFEFKATSTASGKAIYLAALTSANLNPQLNIPMTTCAAAPYMDEIGVKLITSDPGSPAGLYVCASVYDNGTDLSPSNIIGGLSYGTIYYARLKVYGNARGELFLYSNPTRTALVGNFCFAVPRTVTGLRFLQHATVSLAGPSRKTSATVDNTSIYQTGEPCCILTWNGAINHFGTRYEAGDFQLVGDEVTEKQVNLDEYGDVVYSFTEENALLSVSDWGTVDASTGLKQIVIAGTGKCRCEVLTTTKNVYVGPFTTKSAAITDPIAVAYDRQMTIYPNPASGKTTIEFEEDIREVVLLTTEGVVLETFSVSEAQKSASIDLSAQAAGIYLIRIVTASGTTVEQVIKK